MDTIRVGYVHSVRETEILWQGWSFSLAPARFSNNLTPPASFTFFQAPLLDSISKESIPAVDVGREIEEVRRTLKESGQRVSFRAEVATVGNFGALLSRGVEVLHYSGNIQPASDKCRSNCSL